MVYNLPYPGFGRRVSGYVKPLHYCTVCYRVRLAYLVS